MARSTLVAVLLLVAPNPATGQMDVGLRGGWSGATMVGEGLQDARRQIGFHVGGFLGLPLTEVLGVEVGVTYAQKGVSTEINTLDLGLDIDYVGVPLLAKLRIPTGGALRPHLTAGPVLSRRVSCRADASDGAFFVDASCDDPTFEGDLDIDTFDLGVQLGGGVSAAIGGRSRLHFDAMYNIGVSDTGLDPDEPIKNRVLLVAAGISLGIGH